MIDDKQNADRAKKVVEDWPEWKKNFQLTKYKVPERELESHNDYVSKSSVNPQSYS